MHLHFSIPHTHESIPVKRGVVVLSGYALRVSVEHGRLNLIDGVRAARRALCYSRATRGIKRLVLLGHSGAISLQALRRLRDIKAAVVQIDADGQLVLATSPLTEGLTRLRRAQVNAITDQTGTCIVRRLVVDKLVRQSEIAQRIGDIQAAEHISTLASGLVRENGLERDP